MSGSVECTVETVLGCGKSEQQVAAAAAAVQIFLVFFFR